MNRYEFEDKFNSTVSNCDDFFLRIANDSSKPSLPKHKFDWFSDSIKAKLNRTLFIVKFFPKQDVFIVWDNKRHKDIPDAGGSFFDLGMGWDSTITGSDVFRARYKELGRHNSGIYEKIYVVGLSNFDKFFQDYDIYMRFNALDDDFPSNSSQAIEEEKAIHWTTESKRKKYSSSQYRRDKQFQEAVFAAYGHKCAICRCDINEVLQAAHEEGYDVAHTNYDDPKHGICLCANHHLMYDKKLIGIDLKQLTIKINKDEEKIKDTLWYKHFIETYGGRIIRRT